MIKVIKATKGFERVYLFSSKEAKYFKNNGYNVKLVNLCIETRKEI